MTEQLDTPMTTATCPFDHHAETLRGPDKYEAYADLRGRRVQRTDEHGGYWILTHAADVEAALLDRTTFSSQRDGGNTEATSWTNSPPPRWRRSRCSSG